MLHSKSSIPILVLTSLVVASITFVSIGHGNKLAIQEAEKSLDIERYPNEPLELVDLKVGGNSVKDKIRTKLRKNNEGLDSVKFNEQNGWFRRVSVRLRNVSGKPINGLRAYLYFKSPASQSLFSIPVMRTKEITIEALQPGDEIDLVVSDQLWKQMAEIFRQHGVDADLSSVTLSVESAMFGDGSQWYRGKLLRRDPDNQLKWVPVEVGTLNEVGELSHRPRFIPAAFFKSSAARPVLRCVQDNDSYTATHCSENNYCFTFEELGNGQPGTKSSVSVIRICEQEPGVAVGGITCSSITTHSLLQEDPSCPPVTPTPTPTPTPTQD